MTGNDPGNKRQPHLQWQEESAAFAPKPPAAPPIIAIDVHILDDVHKQLGKVYQPRHSNNSIQCIKAIADTGCQTCTAGKDLLKALKCPQEYLISTKHQIVGITDTSLKVLGALMLSISFRGRTTQQMVYISNNTSGFYLSETALKDLNVVHSKFPHASKAAASTGTCECAQRGSPPKRPDKLPFPPTEDNVARLEQWLLASFGSSAFNTCTHQPLQSMTGEPVHARFKEGATPYAVHTPIPVPHHWKETVKHDIDRDVRLGIIEPVPQGTPTTWCARMVVAPKKDGTPRRTVDLQHLNKATLRETHHTPSPFNLVSTIPPRSIKTVCDAWNGYHSLELAEEARNATTFITEWGRYRYCRAPMGFHTSGDAYTRRFDDITVDVQRTVRCVDDTLLWDNSIEDAFWHTFDFLSLCSTNGIVFNREKFIFARSTIDFAGFEITPSGYRPPKRIISAIQDFPTPTNITDIRLWFGLVNQVAYAFAQAKVMEPFRELLASKTQRLFFWDETMDTIFQKSKEEIIWLIQKGVQSFEKDRPTCLATDWSKTGIGFILTQKHCRCIENTPECGQGHWKIVLAGSRFTREAERRYAPIEGEALAVAYGLQCSRMFILGHPNLIVAVDHKPLIKILNDRSLDSIDNPRMINIKEKTLMYNFRIIHVAGTFNAAPDAASRYPTSVKSDRFDDDVSVALAIRQKLVPYVTIGEVEHAAAIDEECLELAQTISNGFPESHDLLPEILRYYWQMRENMYTIGNVSFRGKKMLIPQRLRNRVLEGLHIAHQGVTGMIAYARDRFFWPGLDADIRQKRAQCKQCIKNAPSQHTEPLMISPDPEVPFQQTAADLCDLEGHHFLIYADRYSGWVEGIKLSNSTFRTVRKHLLNWFTTFGAPEELATDGGPPFNSNDYDKFLRSWDVRKRLSSAHYPQSNGRAEAAVKTAKRILMGNINRATGEIDTDAAAAAIMIHRNTPNQMTGVSPAVALYGHPIRDHLPNQHGKLRQEWQEIYDARETALAKRHLRSPITEASRELLPLETGDAVAIQNQVGNKPGMWSNTGIIVEVLPHRQYRIIVDGSRRMTLRNRRFLRKIDPICRQPKQVTPQESNRQEPGQPVTDNTRSERTQSIDLDNTPQPQCQAIDPDQVSEPQSSVPATPEPMPKLVPQTLVTETSLSHQPTLSAPPIPTTVHQVRRSTRTRRAPTKLNL